MRDNVEAARDAGVNLAFLGANNAYWQIRLEPSNAATGAQANRTVVAYRENAGNDPVQGQLITRKWRELPTPRPEAALIGVQYIFNSLDSDMVIDNCAGPLCNGTVSPTNTGLRLQAGDKLLGMLGYEVDAVIPGVSPATIETIAASPFVCPATYPGCDGSIKLSHMTTYTAASGAKVFATGSMNWNWGLDNVGPYGNARVNTNVQQITRNVFDSFVPAPAKKIVTNGSVRALNNTTRLSENTSIGGSGCTLSALTGQYDISLLMLLFGGAAFRYRRLMMRFSFNKILRSIK
jgi:hypothetical protein